MSPTEHHYTDAEYVAEWEAQADRRRPHRTRMFELISQLLDAQRGNLRVLELGSGPGVLASRLLRNLEISAYDLVDISPRMHDLARTRLERDGHQGSSVSFVIRDLNDAMWTTGLAAGYDAIVTNQAVHEVGSPAAIRRLYVQAATLLSRDGCIIVSDRVNDGRVTPVPNLITVAEHIDALTCAGLEDARYVAAIEDLRVFTAHRNLEEQ